MINYPFQPIGNTANMTPSAATATVNFISSWPYSGGGNVRVANTGAAVGYIAFASSASGNVTAATGMPIQPGTVELFTVGRDQTWAIGIGTSALYFTPGQGGV